MFIEILNTVLQYNSVVVEMFLLLDDIRMIKYRIQEKGIDFVTEQKVEIWRRDMSQELQLMHSQLQLHSNEEHQPLQVQDTHKSTLVNDFHEL